MRKFKTTRRAQFPIGVIQERAEKDRPQKTSWLGGYLRVIGVAATVASRWDCLGWNHCFLIINCVALGKLLNLQASVSTYENENRH